MGDPTVCLRWDNHQHALALTFPTLLEKQVLVDCTLAAEGRFLSVHKVVLSACSPYFEALVRQNYDKHPIFLLKDVKFDELRAIVDYMYRGEANVAQNQFSSFIQTAKFLQIKGLSECENFMPSENSSGKEMNKINKVASSKVDEIPPSTPLVSSTPLAQKRKRAQSFHIDRAPPVSAINKQMKNFKQSVESLKSSNFANIPLKLASNTAITVKPLTSRNVQAKAAPLIGGKIDNATKVIKDELSIDGRIDNPTKLAKVLQQAAIKQESLMSKFQQHSSTPQTESNEKPQNKQQKENATEKTSNGQTVKSARTLKRSASTNLFEIKIDPEPVLYNSMVGVINENVNIQKSAQETGPEAIANLEPKVVATDEGHIRFVCPLCGSQFPTKSGVRLHMRRCMKSSQRSASSEVIKPQRNPNNHPKI